MDLLKTKNNKIIQISIIIIVFLLLINIFKSISITAPNWWESDYGNTLDIEFDIYDNGEKIATTHLPYLFDEVPTNEKIEIIGTLPNDPIVNNSFISFRASGFNIIAEVNNEEIYNYCKENCDSISGGYWHFIALPSDSANQELKITYCCPSYNPLTVNLYPILIGSKGYLLKESFQNKYQSIFFGIVLFAFGFVFLGSIIFVNHSISNSFLLSLSQLLFCFGSWVLFQSGARQLIGMNNPVIPMTISFFTMFALPFCLWYYLQANYKKIGDYKILKYSAYFIFLLYIPISLISFLGVPYTFFLLPIGSLLAIFMVLLLIISIKILVEGEKSIYSCVIAISGLFISIIAENILLTLKIFIQDISLLHLSMAVASMIFIYKSIGNLIEKNNEINEAKLIKKMAYIDGVTLINNRNAFEKFTSEEYRKFSSFGIIFADVNCLKKINDNKGHKFGDKLLINFSKTLKKALPENNYLYRIGGDEFVGIIPNCNKKEFEDLVSNLQKQFEPKNDFFGLAIGSYFFESNKDISLDRAIDIADKDMYKNKEKQKMFF